jgi:hypothetical protein
VTVFIARTGHLERDWQSRGSWDFSPKGYNKSAQGTALGTRGAMNPQAL